MKNFFALVSLSNFISQRRGNVQLFEYSALKMLKATRKLKVKSFQILFTKTKTNEINDTESMIPAFILLKNFTNAFF